MYSSHCFHAPMSVVPAVSANLSQCAKVAALLDTLRPEDFCTERKQHLDVVFVRLQDMASGLDTIHLISDDENGNRLTFLREHLQAFIDCPEIESMLKNQSDWVLLLNIGYPALFIGKSPISKFGISVPLYETSDGITAVAEVAFVPCSSPIPKNLRCISGSISRFRDVSTTPDTPSCIGTIDLFERAVWDAYQHISGRWFTMMPLHVDRITVPKGREKDTRLYLFCTSLLRPNQWEITDFKNCADAK